MAKKSEAEAIANQMSFVADEVHRVSGRLDRAGFVELAAEMTALANSTAFFAEELDRQRGSRHAAENVMRKDQDRGIDDAPTIRALLAEIREAEDRFLSLRGRLHEVASRGRTDKASLEQAVKQIIAVVLSAGPRDIAVVNNAVHGFHVWRPARFKDWLVKNGYVVNPSGRSYSVSLPMISGASDAMGVRCDAQ